MSTRKANSGPCRFLGGEQAVAKRGIVTTSLKEREGDVLEAKRTGEIFNLPYVRRRGKSIERLLGEEGADYAIVVGEEPKVVMRGGVELVHSIGTYLIRVKTYISRGYDPLLSFFDPEDRIIADCTLGFGMDALFYSTFFGEKVWGVESEAPLVYLTIKGFERLKESAPKRYERAKKACEKIEVLWMDFREFLQAFPEGFFDVAYIDPMFFSPTDHHILSRIRKVANTSPVSYEDVELARAKARKVIIRLHLTDPLLPAIESIGGVRVVRVRNYPAVYLGITGYR